jgi:hypothetical protein
LYKPDTTGSSMGALLNDNIAEITIEIPTINKKLTVANVGTLMAIGERKNKIIRNSELDLCITTIGKYLLGILLRSKNFLRISFVNVNISPNTMIEYNIRGIQALNNPIDSIGINFIFSSFQYFGISPNGCR